MNLNQEIKLNIMGGLKEWGDLSSLLHQKSQRTYQSYQIFE